MNKYSDLQLRNSVSRLTPLNIITPKSSTFDGADVVPKHSSTKSLSKDTQISMFSQIENWRTEVLTNRILFTPQQLHPVRALEKLNSPDFKKILTSLNKISLGPDIEDIKEVIHSQTEASFVEEGKTIYYKIYTKEKKGPLKIEAKRKHGKIQWFISKSYKNPYEGVYDFTFISDFFEIDEVKPAFVNEWFYIGVQGLSDCEFWFTIRLGNTKKNFSSDEKPSKSSLYNKNSSIKTEESRYNLIIKVEKLLRDRKEKALKFANGKNFIKLNKESSKSSVFKLVDPWNERKEIALSKKKIRYQEKVQRAKDSMNRKVVRLERMQTEAWIEKNNKRDLKVRQTLWAKIIFFIKNTEILYKLVMERREFILSKVKNNIMLRKIQRSIRRFIYFMKSNQIALLIARKNLMFMHSFLFVVEKCSIDSYSISLAKSNSSRLISNCIKIFTQKSNKEYKSSKGLRASIKSQIFKKLLN